VKLSRRKFVKAGIIAAVCAPLLPLKRIVAQGKTGQPSSANLNQLSYYNEAAFKPYVNTSFRVYLSPSETRSLELIKVSDYDTSSQQSPLVYSSECFSLLFTIPPGQSFTQDTYLIEHDALGTFYLFVVPISPPSKQSSDFYEAVIYRREMYWTDRVSKTTKKKPSSLTTSQAVTTSSAVITSPSVTKSTTQPKQSVLEGAPLLILPGIQDVKSNPQDVKPNPQEESDVYRFRPAETASIALAEQANIAPPPKKTVYPLALSQSPIINGLKLGMTADQVLALFPGSKTDAEVQRDLSRPPSQFGVSSFTIKPQKYSSKSKFDRVTQITFTLFDGRVSTLYVGYDSPIWEHVDDYVTDFNKGRNLPAADEWEAYVGMDTELKTLNCKEFEISLFAGGQNVNINYAQVRDLVALQKYKERREKSKAKG
jgi:hypothetical protein